MVPAAKVEESAKLLAPMERGAVDALRGDQLDSVADLVAPFLVERREHERALQEKYELEDRG